MATNTSPTLATTVPAAVQSTLSIVQENQNKYLTLRNSQETVHMSEYNHDLALDESIADTPNEPVFFHVDIQKKADLKDRYSKQRVVQKISTHKIVFHKKNNPAQKSVKRTLANSQQKMLQSKQSRLESIASEKAQDLVDLNLNLHLNSSRSDRKRVGKREFHSTLQVTSANKLNFMITAEKVIPSTQLQTVKQRPRRPLSAKEPKPQQQVISTQSTGAPSTQHTKKRGSMPPTEPKFQNTLLDFLVTIKKEVNPSAASRAKKHRGRSITAMTNLQKQLVVSPRQTNRPNPTHFEIYQQKQAPMKRRKVSTPIKPNMNKLSLNGQQAPTVSRNYPQQVVHQRGLSYNTVNGYQSPHSLMSAAANFQGRQLFLNSSRAQDPQRLNQNIFSAFVPRTTRFKGTTHYLRNIINVI